MAAELESAAMEPEEPDALTNNLESAESVGTDSSAAGSGAKSDTPDFSSSEADVSGGEVPSSEDVVSSGDAVSSGNVSPAKDIVSSGDVVSPVYEIIEVDADADSLEFLQSVQEIQVLLLESSQRIELQNEAVISILLIFLIVGLLSYVYRFFRLFF